MDYYLFRRHTLFNRKTRCLPSELQYLLVLVDQVNCTCLFLFYGSVTHTTIFTCVASLFQKPLSNSNCAPFHLFWQSERYRCSVSLLDVSSDSKWQPATTNRCTYTRFSRLVSIRSRTKYQVSAFSYCCNHPAPVCKRCGRHHRENSPQLVTELPSVRPKTSQQLDGNCWFVCGGCDGFKWNVLLFYQGGVHVQLFQ